MRLTNNIDPTSHEIGDEIWHTSLRQVLREEAEKTVQHLPAAIIRPARRPGREL
jgi:hypothetical protein